MKFGVLGMLPDLTLVFHRKRPTGLTPVLRCMHTRSIEGSLKNPPEETRMVLYAGPATIMTRS